MKRLVTATAICCATLASAGQDFGTFEEAKALAESLVAIIDTDGLDAARLAVTDPQYPFRHSLMGVNLFEGSYVIADNREPETVAADYATTADLNGNLVYDQIMAAADGPGDAVLKWYHYDTQEVYDYHCYSLRANRENGMVMVCR